MRKINLSKLIHFICIFFIPLFSVYLGFHKNIIKYNFTYLSSQSETNIKFYIWAIITNLTCCLGIFLIKQKHLLFKPLKRQIFLLFILFFITMVIPYKAHNSIVSLLHVLFAYVSIIYLNYILFTIYNFLKLKSYKYCKFLSNFYIIIFSACFILSMYFGSISTLVELIYILSLCIIFYILLSK